MGDWLRGFPGHVLNTRLHSHAKVSKNKKKKLKKMKQEALVVAEQAMEATIFKTILNVGAGNTTTTQGKEEVISAVHQFLDAMKQQGLVILNKAFDS